MWFPYIVTGFVLASLSVAHPHRDTTGPPPVQTITHLNPARTSSPGPTAAPRVAVCSPGLDTAGCDKLPLTKRDEWGRVAGQGIKGAENIVSMIFDIIGGKRPGKEPQASTVTAPGTLTTITITGGPEKPTGPVTVTTTLVTVPVPTETKIVHAPVPNPGGCYYAQPDGGIETRPCGSPL